MWMEKEQLFQISVSVKQLTATRNEPSQPAQFVPDSPPGPFPISAEFKTGELAFETRWRFGRVYPPGAKR